MFIKLLLLLPFLCVCFIYIKGTRGTLLSRVTYCEHSSLLADHKSLWIAALDKSS